MLNKNIAEKCFSYILENGGDFGEIFLENTKWNNIEVFNKEVKKVNSGLDYGLGLRIFSKLKSVYLYTNDTSEENILKLAKSGLDALKEKNYKNDKSIAFTDRDVQNLSKIKINPNTIAKSEKVKYMKEAASTALKYDKQISEAKVVYLDSDRDFLIANTEGVWKQDKRILSRAMVQSYAESKGEKQLGYFGPAAQVGYEYFELIDLNEIAKKASKQAITILNADFCKSLNCPVILSNGFGGVLFHEACGHSLEASSVAKNTSVFSNRLGSQIASPLLTAIDDGTIPNSWGSINIDDEGRKSQKNVLIENGILKSYLVDKLNARRMNTELSSSARRESYAYAPTSRMTNTYIANGKSSFDEIIANTEFALYAKNLGGGSVDPSTGAFNFTVLEGYMVRNGKIEEAVRGAALIGKGEEILKKIDMIGNDLKLSEGICGSSSGSIPVTVGQPSLRVSEMIIGGRA